MTMGSDCGCCGRPMTDADYGPEGHETACLRCNAAARRSEARLRALVAQAHAEGRMPQQLRRTSRRTIDFAMSIGDE